MSDLLDRLRCEHHTMYGEAADRIEALESSLRDILKFKVEWELVGIMAIAHRALEGRKWDES